MKRIGERKEWEREQAKGEKTRMSKEDWREIDLQLKLRWHGGWSKMVGVGDR